MAKAIALSAPIITRLRFQRLACSTFRPSLDKSAATRALARLFGEVHAVDVSGEMVRLARETVADLPNAYIYQNNGKDLDVLDSRMFDFAFSTCVFHHIPSKAVIEDYISAVSDRLRPGCLSPGLDRAPYSRLRQGQRFLPILASILGPR